MQAENPCTFHEQNSVSLVCLTKQCQMPHIFCDKCLLNHNKHLIMPYKEFEKKYGEYQETYGKAVGNVRKNFDKVRDTFALCIKRAEERVLKQYVPGYNPTGLLKLGQIQTQQLYGIVQNISSDEKFKKYLADNVPIEKLNNQINENMADMSTYTDGLNTSIMVAINKFMSQAILSLMNEKLALEQKDAEMQQSQAYSYFKFTKQFKPDLFTISEDGKCISRNSTLSHGLSMYAVLDQPLSKEHDTINFTIVRQERRFMYFGVCDNERFKVFGFKGPLYEKGNRMYAIRQSPKQGDNGVCLHNSLEQFSNKDTVPFDFDVGDVISIRYFQKQNRIVFSKNGKEKFQMPLDKNLTKFYPFVGLKFNKDTVRVSSQQQKKKKGIFQGLFKSSVK